jgi:hypothetical protein
MDGVIADFHKEYDKYDPNREDRKKFRSAVIDHRIFEKLDFMPDAQELLNHVSKLNGVTVEMLTSVGTHDPFQGQCAKEQKQNWLNSKNIPWKVNFVQDKGQKAAYATATSILVDDSIGCITPFNDAGGYGILHTNAKDTIDQLNSTFKQILTLEALRNHS